MHSPSNAFRLIAFIIALGAVIACARGTPAASTAATVADTYPTLIAAAQAAAAEGSWEQAKAAYLKARENAPNADAVRWCDLWIEDAGWRSQLPMRWQYGQNWSEEHLARYDAFERPYADGRARDEFWIAAVTSRSALESALGDPAAWLHRSAIADHLAAQPPSAEAARRFVSFLQALAAPSNDAMMRPGVMTMRRHLADGARIGADADDRGWCSWQLARLNDDPMVASEDQPSRRQERADRWSTALAAVAGTRWSGPARAEEFIWRISSGWAPTLPASTPADVPAILAELQSVRDHLGNSPSPALDGLRVQLTQLEKGLRDPRLAVELGNVVPPDSPVRFAYGTSGLTQLDATLERVPPADWLAIPDGRFPKNRPGERAGASPGTELIRNWSIDLPAASTLEWRTNVVDAVASLPAGLYSLTLRGKTSGQREPLVQHRKFVVSSLRGFAELSSATEGRLFVYRPAGGVPAANTPVNGLTLAQNQRVTTWKSTTTADGSVVVPALDAFSREIVAYVADEPVWFTVRGLYGGPPHALLVDVYTDRPLFRPGETAHWKLIARDRHGDQFTVPSDLLDLKLRIKLGDSALVEPTPLKLNAYGSAHGELKIPDDARPATAVLELYRGETQRPDMVDSATALFQVDRFVPPAAIAAIDLTSGARSLRPGQQITLRVNASYFSGGPLVNAPVRLQVTPVEKSYLPLPEPTAGWAKTLAEEPLHGATDAAGGAEFTLMLPSNLPENTALQVAASVMPQGAASVDATSTMTISSSGLTLAPLGWTTARLGRPGDTIDFKAEIRNGQGAPAAFEGRAQLLEIRWSEVWLDSAGRIVSDTALADAWREAGSTTRRLPDDWKLVYAGYTETVAADCAIATGADGRLNAAFPLPHAGLFRLRVSSDSEIMPETGQGYGHQGLFRSQRRAQGGDTRADLRREALSVVAVDEQTRSLALNPETAAVIVAGPFERGQPLRVLGVAPEGSTRAWMSLRGESRIVAEPVPLNGRLALHRFDRPPSLLGGGVVAFSHSSPDVTAQSTATAPFAVSNSAHTLQVSIHPALEEQRPGQVADVIVTAKDPAGLPAAATELAVGVSDEALNSLVNRETEASNPSFLHITSTVPSQTLWSEENSHESAAIPDPRVGAIRNPSSSIADENGVIVLSAFNIASDSFNYSASRSTLAGSRMNPSLADKGSSLEQKRRGGADDFAEPPPPTIELRSHFASTAFWTPAAVTDANGEARIRFTYPDNLTRWRIGAYAVGADGTTFGQNHAFTRTSLPFQARLQLPRFLIVGDSAEPSAILLNRTDAEVRADATLQLAGPVATRDPAALTRTAVQVAGQAESRLSWPIQAKDVGEAQLTLTARTAGEGDAMALPLPILEDGIQQHTAAFGRLAATARETRFTLDLPATLDAARTEAWVQISPNYATTLLDALPYLVDFPYGCVEQTMNRFLPAVIVRKTLVDLGLNAASVERRILSSETPADRKRRESTGGLRQLDAIMRQSLARLDEAHSYSGFGWWPGASSPDLWMTAYVSWGLSLAVAIDVELPDGLYARTTQALVNGIAAASTVDDRLAFAWAALARVPSSEIHLPHKTVAQNFTRAYVSREQLSASGRACLALASKAFGTPEQSAILLRNLDNGLQRASAAGLGETVHWGTGRNFWRASDGAVESTALTLLALLELAPNSPLIEPAANWLVLNRRSAHWANTRDTAFAVLALNAYLQQHGDLGAAGEIELLANGKPVQRVSYSRETLLATPSRIAVPITALRGGTTTFTLRRISGTNPIHAVALASSWARGDEVKPAGHLIDVARRFERQKAAPTLVGTLRISPQTLPAGGPVVTGEEVVARVTLTVPNALEYVMIEVPKPAGCEPLNPLSGWDARLVEISPAKAVSNPPPPLARLDRMGPRENGRPVYREEYDDRSVFFIDQLTEGTWELRFGLRAVTAGDFRALPVNAGAMYAPEVRANSDAQRVRLQRAKD